MKICNICFKNKNLINFPKAKGCQDGYRGYCKSCLSIKNKESYEINKEERLKKCAIYRSENKEKIKDYKKIYRKNNGDKIKEDKKKHYIENKINILEKCKIYRNDNKELYKERSKKYYLKNKESILEYQKEYAINNKEKIVKRRKEYHIENRESICEKTRNYSKTEIGKISKTNNSNKRRFEKVSTSDKTIPLNVKQPLTKELQELLYKQDNKCFYCDCELICKHLDHVVPLSKGGIHSLSNVVWSCPKCNLSKGDKLLSEFKN